MADLRLGLVRVNRAAMHRVTMGENQTGPEVQTLRPRTTWQPCNCSVLNQASSLLLALESDHPDSDFPCPPGMARSVSWATSEQRMLQDNGATQRGIAGVKTMRHAAADDDTQA